MGMLVALTAIAALCMAPPVRAGGGSFYATVTNATQLIADINYANTNGGTFTINLQPNTTFDLLTVNGSDAFGGEMLPIIGVTNAVNLTILGNGDTIQRDVTTSEERLLEVAEGSSLTLDQMTLQNGYAYAFGSSSYSDAFNGGAIFNFGTLVISNCTLSGNTVYPYLDDYDGTTTGGKGGAICNWGGTVIISDSFLSNNAATGAGFTGGGAIYNNSGTVTISHSTISGNSADYYDDDGEAYGFGGGIYNSGTVTVENSSSITGNDAAYLGPDVDNLGTLYLDGTSTIGVLDGNSAIGLSPVLSINSWSSTAHQLVLFWSTNYTDCTLQSSTDLSSTNWTDCASPTVSGASFVVTNSMSAGAQFFRLKR
jgi:hypothetical protein